VLDALKQVLQQHSSVSADDPLQQQFEQAVLLFVSGEHRAAAAALQGVQAAAEAQGKKAIAGKCMASLTPLCLCAIFHTSGCMNTCLLVLAYEGTHCFIR
jgi:hypothetical protein